MPGKGSFNAALTASLYPLLSAPRIRGFMHLLLRIHGLVSFNPARPIHRSGKMIVIASSHYKGMTLFDFTIDSKLGCVIEVLNTVTVPSINR